MSDDPEFELDPGVLASLPIFPLGNCVLLPHGLLPLHIFEPRYRELTRDCLRTSRVMAIARLCRDGAHDAYGRPAVHPTAGLGHILASEELPDGRYMLVLRGIGRVQIIREHPPTRAYRCVQARTLDDARTTAPDEMAGDYKQLITLCDHLAHVLPQGGDQLRDLVRRSACPGACADAVTAAIIHDADERQRLLEMLCPSERVARAIGLVGALICELAPHTGDAN